MKIVSLFALSLLLLACGNTKTAVSESAEESSTTESAGDSFQKPQRNVMLKSRIGEFKESDPFNYESAKLEGNTLFLTISYSGGCAEHKFEVIGSAAIMKSLPPKRTVQVVHDSNGDACRGMVTRVLEIDLSNIAYNDTPGSEIVLLFQDYSEEILYTLK